MARPLLRLRRIISRRILHVDDTPRAIALGASIAMFIAILPLIGIQTFVAIAVAAAVRANKAVCIPVVWITNPFTAFPIYYGCYWLGRRICGGGAPAAEAAEEAEVVKQLVAVGSDVHLWELAFWKQFFYTLVGMGAELWVGCVIVGIVLAVPTYFAVRWAVVHHRERRLQRVHRRHRFREALRLRRRGVAG